jgi:membrane protein DedA with SNARE-associated domain
VGGVTETITTWIGDYGLYAIFLLSVIDAVLPAASEVVMVYGGALAAGAFAGHSVTLFGTTLDSTWAAYLAVALAGTLGYVLGSVGGWAIGRYGGHAYLERHGRWLHVTPDRLERAERWFERWGDVSVLVGRCVPVVRSFISIPAGVVEMPVRRFTVLTTIGSVPWYFGLAAIGVALGASWERFHDSFRYADYLVVALVVGGVVALAARSYRRRRDARRASAAP